MLKTNRELIVIGFVSWKPLHLLSKLHRARANNPELSVESSIFHDHARDLAGVVNFFKN